MNDIVKVSEPEQPDSLLAIIANAAQNPNVDVEKMAKLLAMKREIDAEKAKQAYNRSLKSAQEEMRVVGYNRTNSQTRSSYATLEKIDAAVRPIYTKHGFSLSYDTGDAPEGFVRVLCTVAHEDGHERTYKIDVPSDGKGAKGNDVMTKTHATGSGLSYGRRYLLTAIFNIQTGENDDDGNQAGGIVCVSDEQASDIRRMIEETGADVKRFCEFYKVDAITSIPANRYEGVMRDLNQKKAAEARKHGGS